MCLNIILVILFFLHRSLLVVIEFGLAPFCVCVGERERGGGEGKKRYSRVKNVVFVSKILAAGCNKVANFGTGNIPLLPCQTWVPRIQLHFRAEDPRAFARRVANAYMARLDCETELRYHLCIDCMPMDDVVELERSSFERMKNFVLTTPRIIQKKGL